MKWMNRRVLCVILLVAFSLSAFAAQKVLEFSSMITCEGIDRAVAGFANEVNGASPMDNYRGLMSTANNWARRSVYQEVFGPDYYDKIYDATGAAQHDFKEATEENREVHATYKLILKVAREALKTPTGLKAVYKLHRARLLGQIRHAGVAREVKAELERVLPYFDGTLPAKKKALIELYIATKKAYYDGSLKERTLVGVIRDLHEDGIGRSEVYVYKFAGRRFAEGGQPLLNGYRDIIKHAMENL